MKSYVRFAESAEMAVCFLLCVVNGIIFGLVVVGVAEGDISRKWILAAPVCFVMIVGAISHLGRMSHE